MQATKGIDPDAEILISNPYETHQDLTPTEAQVLWEYAKLNVHLKQVRLNISSPSRGLLIVA
jgi:DASH complex subunit DAD3